MGPGTRQPRVVAEAVKLFDADATRQPYAPGLADLVVSPLNARARLGKLVASARRELLIYDPRLIDRSMVRALQARVSAGVDIRIIGAGGQRATQLQVSRFGGKRLHLRAILRDQRELFIGSQSLRTLELDRRREVGLIVRDPRALRRFKAVFEADWSESPLGRETSDSDTPAEAPTSVGALAIA